ncbi:TPA: hypothetical protein VPF81_000870 [Streptococcus pyogenes]|nr:hypothetical protein [Streptococcus pyogenes]HES9129459.1 hypothetical protein [Streptococcus pyogenes]
MSKKLFSKTSIVVALMGMGLFIANPIKADSRTPWWQPNVEGMCGDNLTGYYKCENQGFPHTPEASPKEKESNEQESGEDDSPVSQEDDSPVSQIVEWLLDAISSWLNSIFSSID